MQLKKKLALLAAAPVAASGLLVATPAHAAPGAAVCVVVGSDHLNPGVHVNPTVPSSGTFTFVSSVLVCAGSLTGAATVNASGTYNEAAAPNLPTFTGTLSTGAFGVGGACTGSVSGSRVGPVVQGSLNVTCDGFAGSGFVVLAFQPNPLTIVGTTTDPIVTDVFMEGAAVLASLA